MTDYRYCISLRVTHPNIDPEEITRELGIEPFREWKMGKQRFTPKGTLLEGLNKGSYWAANMHSEKRILSANIVIEEYLAKLNDKFNIHKEYFASLVASGGCIEYFIGWFSADNVGITLDTALMKQTSELNIEIGLCAYIGEE